MLTHTWPLLFTSSLWKTLHHLSCQILIQLPFLEFHNSCSMANHPLNPPHRISSQAATSQSLFLSTFPLLMLTSRFNTATVTHKLSPGEYASERRTWRAQTSAKQLIYSHIVIYTQYANPEHHQHLILILSTSPENVLKIHLEIFHLETGVHVKLFTTSRCVSLITLPYFGKWAHELSLLWPVWSENKPTLPCIWDYLYKKQKKPHTATPPTVVLSVSLKYSMDPVFLCLCSYSKIRLQSFWSLGHFQDHTVLVLLAQGLLLNNKIIINNTTCYISKHEELTYCTCLICSNYK